MPTPTAKPATLVHPTTTEVPPEKSTSESDDDFKATKPYRLVRGIWSLINEDGDRIEKVVGDIVHLTEEEAERHKKNIKPA